MKNLIKLVTIFILTFVFIGCGSSTPLPEIPVVKNNENGSYTVSAENYTDATNSYFKFGTANYKDDSIFKYGNYEELKRAAEFTLESKAKYFAVINEGTNNLEGFPLTNLKDLISYCQSYFAKKDSFQYENNQNHKCELARSSLKIAIFKEQIPGLYLWDANATLKELY